MKKCPCCKRVLPFSAFNKCKGRKYGLKAYCKECQGKKDKVYRQSDAYKKSQIRYHGSDKCKKQQKKYYETYMKKHRQTKDGREMLRNNTLKSRYGITAKEHKSIWQKQNGCCDLCGSPLQYENVHTDHNHITNNIRGLVCQQCNHGLGLFYVDEKGIDILYKAIDYIKRHDKP